MKKELRFRLHGVKEMGWREATTKSNPKLHLIIIKSPLQSSILKIKIEYERMICSTH